ncbi:hypothetical protein L596_025613 [Steinernema carpocapsae]|uniref:Peptidase metallopeptidase domain-containing protein n=1 Tax=Steinernema carpocapsae TaxID=34508 RepID=A0A4U5M8A9_STECR|nr:hypothetical protein L596_025613 [Steinernema carpocapsae]
MAPLPRSTMLLGPLFAGLLVLVASSPVSRRPAYYENAVDYLNSFGYLKTKSPTFSEMKAALETFQDLLSIERTGELDSETIEEMKRPRCGNSDVPTKKTGRSPRFLYRSKWENKMTGQEKDTLTLTWFIASYTNDLTRTQIQETVKKAFSIWTREVDLINHHNIKLIFEEADYEDEADIVIMWAKGDHDDPFPFDDGGHSGGQTNVLAHTFYPIYASLNNLNGDIHLDDYEKWTIDPEAEGANFLDVLTHEIGHSLGLGHSRKETALMFPIYRKNSNALDVDDKCAVNWSYMGASNFCMFIWLLGEVIPTKVLDEEEYYNDIPARLQELTDDSRLKLLKRSIRESDIPQCNNEVNNNKQHFEYLLHKKLHFPKSDAEEYAPVVCNFMKGLKAAYGRPENDDNAEGIYRNTVHEYQRAEKRSYGRLVRRELRHKVNGLAPSAFSEDYFNKRFFDEMLRELL